MLRPKKILFSLLSPVSSHTSISCVKMMPPEIYFPYVLRRCTNNQLGEPKYQVSVAIKLQQTSRRDDKALKRTLQELSTPRYPLIYTSKSASAAKLARPFRGKTDQTPHKTQQSRSEAPLQEEREEKVVGNFFFWGLFLSPTSTWSNLFWPAPFWVALLKQLRQGGPPAGSPLRNLGEAKREGGGGEGVEKK